MTVVTLGRDAPLDLMDATIIVQSGLACGTCRCCHRGDGHLCEALRVMGFQAPGGMAALVDVPAEHGALVESVAVAAHAARLAGLLEVMDVLVFGAGTIGLLTALTATTHGANVTVVGPFAQRRVVAKERFGLTVTHKPPEGTCDVAFECVGVEGAIRDAIGSLCKGGTAVLPDVVVPTYG